MPTTYRLWSQARGGCCRLKQLKFYRFVNKKMSCKSGVGTLFDPKSNKTVLTDQWKATLLNDYFTSVGVKDNIKTLNTCRNIADGAELDSIDFTPEKLLKVMRNVKQNSAPGPDGCKESLLRLKGCKLQRYGVARPLLSPAEPRLRRDASLQTLF